jgi:hypothetical protein
MNFSKQLRSLKDKLRKILQKLSNYKNKSRKTKIQLNSKEK